jgi:hypothetical protein
MTEKPYGLVHAKSLLAPCGASGQWEIEERGVFPKPQPKPSEGQTQTVANQLAGYDLLLAWRPAEIFKDDTPAPDLINTPSLPFPFDARDLAAFMLYGAGSFVADFYGKWEDGPDKSAIDQINTLDTFARQAVTEAFAACREAQKTVSPCPLELDAKAERARKAWNVANNEANQREGVFDSELDSQELESRRDRARASIDVLELEKVSKAIEAKAAQSRARRERAKASTVTLQLEMEAAASEARTAQQKWLEAMVRELLTPAKTMPVPATANGMTTQDIAAVFDGLPYKADDWSKRANGKSGAKWLRGARLSLGVQGGVAATWCPLKVAQASYDQASKYDKAKRLKDLNNCFRLNPALAPWKDDWDNLHSIFRDSD